MNPKYFIREGYSKVKKLDSSEIAGILPMLYTHGLCVGLDRAGYRTRFCYPNQIEAEAALALWDGRGDPPGPWIKEKGIGVNRINPKSFAEQVLLNPKTKGESGK